MREERAQTGVANLDDNLEGGIPRGNMVLIAGNPGTGKTLLSGEFLHRGAEEGEQGLYVSLAEGRASFLDYMRKVGRDLESPALPGSVNVMDLVTIKEQGIETLMEGILDRIEELHVERLVVDSFSALAGAFTQAIDARVALHILGKLVKRSGCTTLLVTEVPTGGSSLGLGVEEFLADGIIHLRRENMGGGVLRSLEVTKMRGTEIRSPRQLFTLHGGFRALEPFREKPTGTGPPFTPTPDPPDRFSAGHPQLDQILGGFRRGDTVLIRLGDGVPPLLPALILAPMRANFTAAGRGVMMIPPGGTGSDRVTRFDERLGVTPRLRDALVRIGVFTQEPEAPHVLRLDPDDPKMTHRIWCEEKTRLASSTGQPTLKIVYLDGLDYLWPRDQARRVLDAESAQTKNEGSLLLLLSHPGSEELERNASNLSNAQIEVRSEQGVFLLQGLQPRTQLHAAEMDPEAGYPRLTLTPMQ